MDTQFAQKVLTNVTPQVQKFFDDLVSYRLDLLYKTLETNRDHSSLVYTQGQIAELRNLLSLRERAFKLHDKKG